MAGLDLLHHAQRAAVTVLGGDQAARKASAQDILHGARHAGGGLAGAEQEDAVKGAQIDGLLAAFKGDDQAAALQAQVLREHAVRVGAAQPGVENRFKVGAEGGIHRKSIFLIKIFS